MSRHGRTEAERAEAPGDAVSVSWSEEVGVQANIVSRLGKLCDLVTVARPEKQSGVGYNTLEAALLETGRPVLLCPDMPVVSSVPDRIAIAWNGSTEAVRAVALALPVIAAASSVTILSAGSDLQMAGEDLARYLATHGIEANSQWIGAATGQHDIGRALLDAAHESGTDSLLMGAYGTSRGRALFFGGVTGHVIDHADMPVLLAH